MVGLALALLTVPSYAEMSQVTARSDAQKKSDAEADKAYNAMIKNVPDKARNTDPWADVRGGGTSASNSPANTGTAHTSHTGNKKPK
jgi:hypothetical protein